MDAREAVNAGLDKLVPAGVELAVYSPSDSGMIEIYGGKIDHPELESELEITVADERWLAKVAATPAFFAQHPRPVDVLAFCFIFLAILGGGVVVHQLRGQAATIQQQVDERTEQLNESLLDAKTQEAAKQAVLDTAGDGIITIDAHGTITGFNPAAEHIFAYTQAEVLGHDVNMLMPEPDRSRHHGYISKYLETGDQKSTGNTRELNGLRKSGEQFPIELAISESGLETEATGNGRAFTGIIRDISARKALERELAEREKCFALAIHGSNAGTWDWTVQSNVVFFSPHFKALLGYENRKMANRLEEWESRLHDDDRAGAMAALRAHLEDRRLYDIEYRLKHSSGEYRWFRALGQALWNEQGEAVRMAGSLLDVTAKAAERELAMEGDREACPAGSMDGHVSKPVRRHTLYAAIAEARQQPEDDAFQQQLLTLFPKEATESLSTIASALESDDQVAISAAAHKLKGSAHLVAHSEITDRAAELEAAVREETTELAALCDALREATEGFLKS